MVDGSLNFDTKVDSKGFTKGIKSINSSIGQFSGRFLHEKSTGIDSDAFSSHSELFYERVLQNL